MSLPTVHVQVPTGGWILGDPVRSVLGTSTYLGYSGTTDIAGDLRRGEIRRGRSHELARMESGEATISLRNRDGKYDPTNAAGGLYADLQPGTVITIQAEWAATTYDLFVGSVEDFELTYVGIGDDADAQATLRLVDGSGLLNSEITLSRGAELTGARIAAVLDAAGWSAARSIGAGTQTVSAISLVNANALEHLLDVAASEGGAFYISRNGTATFVDAATLIGAGPDIANDTWGDSSAEKSYVAVTFGVDTSDLHNRIAIESAGHTTQVAEDDASIARYGGPAQMPRVLRLTTLLSTEAAMLSQAQAYLARYAQPRMRIRAMVLDPRADDTQWPQLLVHDIHRIIRVLKRPPNRDVIQQDSYIEALRHEFGAQFWRTSETLSAASTQSGTWILGDPVWSILGETTRI